MNRKIDYWILISTILLIFMGVMMVYSASAIHAEQKLHDSYYFLKRDVIYAVIALAGLFGLSRVDYHHYLKFVYPLLAVTFLLMVLVLIPGIGVKVSGARRWISLGGFSFQPSEIAKFSFLLFMAYSLAKKREKMQNFMVGVFPHLLIGGLIMGFILLQKDLGTTFVLAVVLMLLLFVGGTRVSYLAGGVLIAIPSLYFLVSLEPYRMARVLAFLDPWTHIRDAGFQIIQSYVGFQNGGMWGVGLGAGKQKLFYLPEAHTDFILSVIAEELGMVGVILLVTFFGVLVWRGFRVALRAGDLFGMYLALGITSIIGMQAFINCSVVMGLLPTKGIPLPFISYGGTSLIVMAACVGILLNISTQIELPPMRGNRS